MIRAAHRNRTNTGLRLFCTGTRTVPLNVFFFSVRPVIIRSAWGHGRNLTAVYGRCTGIFIESLFRILILIKRLHTRNIGVLIHLNFSF